MLSGAVATLGCLSKSNVMEVTLLLTPLSQQYVIK